MTPTLILQNACIYNAHSLNFLNEAYKDKAWTELNQIYIAAYGKNLATTKHWFLKNYVINLKMHGAPGTSKINYQNDKRLLF